MKRISMAVVIFSLVISGCTTFSRHPGSGYGDWNSWTKNHLEDEVPAEALSTLDRESMESRTLLRQAEARINSDEDRRQYFRVKPLLTSDKERLEYLALNDRRAKERFIKAYGASEISKVMDRNIASAVETGDITLGMPKGAVLESWGDPAERQVAGNPDFENERWIYYTFVDSADGYQKESRIVYFENGHVTGWETR